VKSGEELFNQDWFQIFGYLAMKPAFMLVLEEVLYKLGVKLLNHDLPYVLHDLTAKNIVMAFLDEVVLKVRVELLNHDWGAGPPSVPRTPPVPLE
jgi:hypothetical protein